MDTRKTRRWISGLTVTFAMLLGGFIKAGEADTEAILEKAVSSLKLAPNEANKIRRLYSITKLNVARLEYHNTIRSKLFDVARVTLRQEMPQIMPTKVEPKVNGLRNKAGVQAMTPAEHTLLRLVIRDKTRKVMMNALYETADRMAGEAARDDLLIAAVIAERIRKALPKDKVMVFDSVLKQAGVTGDFSVYKQHAVEIMKKKIMAYVPNMTGIVDPKTGAILVRRKEVGLPPEDDLGGGIVKILTPILEKIGVNKAECKKLLTYEEIDRVRAEYLLESRDDIFDAARLALSSAMPRFMPAKVSSKIRKIRRRRRAGPPSAADRMRIQLVMKKRIQKIMMPKLHEIADRLASEAVGDDKLMARMLANGICGNLDDNKKKAFNDELGKAGIPADDSTYKAKARQDMRKVIDTYDPDITDIVDSATGKIILKDENL